MDKMDQSIKNAIRAEAPKIPEYLSEAYDRTVESLTKVNRKGEHLQGRKCNRWYPLVSCAASFLLLFVLVNSSADIAYAMQKIPVLGNVIKVITVRDYHIEDEKHFADVVVPKVEGEEGLLDDVNLINADVEELTDAVLEKFYKDAELYPDAYMGLDMNYNVLMNDEEWFSLRITIQYTAASTMTEYVIYNIDKKRNQIVSLGELFTENFDYITAISQNIKKQMKQQMEKDKDKVYFLKGDEDVMDGFDTISETQNFYRNNKDELVIVFDKYEVAPGSMGNPEFAIPKEVYKSFLQS